MNKRKMRLGRERTILVSIGCLMAVGVVSFAGCSEKRKEPQKQTELVRQYAMDEDTARLKREFENAWLARVAGYTNYTTFGMAQDCSDMDKFIKEWKPRILRNQAYKVKDGRQREKMVDRMLKANSIESLYYGLLIPHQEIWDRWSAYDESANALGRLGDMEVRFVNGRARWMSSRLEGCEMSAVILEDCVWPIGGHDAYVLVVVDMSANFDEPSKVASSSLVEYWLVRFQGGALTQATKLPIKDVQWMPCLENAPFGRSYTVRFNGEKVNVVSCVTGEIVHSGFVGSRCDNAGHEEKNNSNDCVVRDANLFMLDFNDFLDVYLDEMRGLFNDKSIIWSIGTEGVRPTTREYKSKYKVVHTDGRTFFSYRAECFTYTGGAHGGTVVKVGTIDVRTGKRLTTADVIPEGKRAEAIAKVREAVIAKIGGEKNLMPTANEVLATLSENFYVGKGGLHFVFAEYSVAPYHYSPELYGPVEVVIPGYGMLR